MVQMSPMVTLVSIAGTRASTDILKAAALNHNQTLGMASIMEILAAVFMEEMM